MAKIRIIPEQIFKVHMVLDEDEARALDALVGYGGKAFVEHFLPTFYEKLGKHYMQPYEKGLEKLFETIRTEVKYTLHNIDAARKAIEDKPKK